MAIILTVDDFQADLNSFRLAGHVPQAVYDELFTLMESFPNMPEEVHVAMVSDELDAARESDRISQAAYDRLQYLAANWLS